MCQVESEILEIYFFWLGSYLDWSYIGFKNTLLLQQFTEHTCIIQCITFQELIQNAEDAEAKEIKFLLDHNSYPTDKLHCTELAKFQVSAY